MTYFLKDGYLSITLVESITHILEDLVLNSKYENENGTIGIENCRIPRHSHANLKNEFKILLSPTKFSSIYWFLHVFAKETVHTI